MLNENVLYVYRVGVYVCVCVCVRACVLVCMCVSIAHVVHIRLTPPAHSNTSHASVDGGRGDTVGLRVCVCVCVCVCVYLQYIYITYSSNPLYTL